MPPADRELGTGRSTHCSRSRLEVQTHYRLLARLCNGRTTENVVVAVKTRIAEPPAQLLKSLSCDGGQELAAQRPAS